MKKLGIALLVVAMILISMAPMASVSAATSLKVQAFNGNTAASSNTLYVNVKLVNTGTDAITLSNVKIRYYYTNDGTQANNFACDWSSIGNGNVTSAFGTVTGATNADKYLEIGFTAGAGTLAAGASLEVKSRVWKSDWSNFTQTNDYSFNATATNYVDSTAVTAFISGTLYWGTEPGSPVSTPTPTPSGVTNTPTPTPSGVTNTPTPTPTATPTVTPTPSGVTATPTVTPTPSTVTVTPTPTPSSTGTNTYKQHFLDLYGKIHNTSNGYFSSKGIPYHSIETLMCEAPDYGHETTSEAMSYYVWLEAMNGNFTGDFSGVTKAWNTIESYMIPTAADQPTGGYNAQKPATYAGEWELPDNYPSQLETSVPVGQDPLASELGTGTMYGMHWIIDVDNWYGFGARGDGTTAPSYMNTFQRGEQESVFETVDQPCWDAFKFGGPNGFLDLFTKDSSYAQQWKYTDAPDADARAIQATYWANTWAKAQGKSTLPEVAKAKKMGDFLRYAMFDKYFKKIGTQNKNDAGGTGYDSCHYLLSWYYAWGGSTGGSWSWRIGCSHIHGGYQNPLAAWVLSTNSDFKPSSANGARDWSTSLTRTIEFYQWLQSSEGAIAGGATNSWNGRYEARPAGTSTFYNMGYLPNPVYHDPGSNTWFGFQCWNMERVAEYYYSSGDAKAGAVVQKWVNWVKSLPILVGTDDFQVPSTLDWSGQPDTWTGTATNNANLHVIIVNYGKDLGVSASLANTLAWYAAKSGDADAKALSKGILDRMWALYSSDPKGVATVETRGDYKRFFEQTVYIPAGWTGKMPNGDPITSGVKFIDIRSKYKSDPQWNTLQSAYNAGVDPSFTYHRFWAQCDIAIANGVFATLFPNG